MLEVSEVADRSLAAEFEMASAVARSALDHWRHVVRTVLLTASFDGNQSALRGLAAWYERMCVDAGYCNAAPDEGLIALLALEVAGDGPFARRLMVTHSVFRIAQELAACRAQWRSADRELKTTDLALAKLELALRAASGHAPTAELA
jgi:hypothetical protein